MADEEEIKRRIVELEKQKSELIDQLRRVNSKLRYKKYEQKALEPFLEQTKNIRIWPLKRQKQIIDFKIATQAYTPKIEKEWIKELKKIDEQLDKAKEIEKVRRKKVFVEQDIAQAEKQLGETETKLNAVSDELKKLYDTRRVIQSITRKGVKMGGFKDDITLGDIGIIETE